MQASTFTLKNFAILASMPVLGFALMSGFPASAYGDEVTATINDWPHGNADVLTGFMEPRIVGRVDADGTVHIPLPPDFTQNTIKETEAQNAGDSEWSVSMRTAGEAWGCETGELKVQNGDQYAAGLATMGSFMIGSMEKEVGYGMLMVTNSREFAENYDPFGGAAPGFYMDWVHAETEIMISGECKHPTLTLPETELETVTNYQIKLSPGWNLLKHEIEEVYAADSGVVYPKKSSYSTVDTLPDDAEFVFVSE